MQHNICRNLFKQGTGDDLPDILESVVDFVIDSEQEVQIQTRAFTRSCIDDIANHNMQDPIHTLRYLQKRL